MSKSKYKEIFSRAISEAFQTVYPEKYFETGQQSIFDSGFVFQNLEKPKDPTMGRFALPVFKYAGLLGDKPQNIAEKISEAADALLSSAPVRTVATGGFINARTDFAEEGAETLRDIITADAAYGFSDDGRGRTVLVEYCSANIAKPFGVGHLRTTILGNSLRKIFQRLGYDAVGINYVGDWGTQFGKMIVAYRKWGADLPVGKETVSDLLNLYVKFHDEEEKNPDFAEEAREAFKNLENGRPEERALWERFRNISFAEWQRVFDIMGIEFDWTTGEAFLNDKIEPVIQRLKKVGLTSVSDGALIVDLHDPQLPPCLLRKADGATLYATRDIVGLLYRAEKYDFHEALYVVASAQSDHFKQVFKVVQMLEEAENVPESRRIAPRAKHIDFGWVKFGEKTMSTRRGNIVFLEDVVNQAVDLAKQKILEKNPDLKNIDETALMIGTGAVIFSQLSVRRQKDVNFDWNEVLSFEGETGPYLQYTHARLCSLMRNYSGKISPDINIGFLDNEEEKRVVELLADAPDAIRDAARNYEPNFISTHLLKLAGAFNKVYQRKDESGKIDKIISDNADLTAARMALVRSVQVVIKEGLYLLGLKAPEEM
ncbi:MAG: arginine--tRNA ligase [Candidatus Zixiibacteriota bacterium]